MYQGMFCSVEQKLECSSMHRFRKLCGDLESDPREMSHFQAAALLLGW